MTQHSAFQTRKLSIKRPTSTHQDELVVAQLYDRRSPTWDEVEWMMQSDLERMLFANQETTGAFYRLLCRTAGYGDTLRSSLSLRRWQTVYSLLSA